METLVIACGMQAPTARSLDTMPDVHVVSSEGTPLSASDVADENHVDGNDVDENDVDGNKETSDGCSEKVVKEKKRVGKGNHNHGEIWKPDKICYMMEHVKDHVYEKNEAHLIDWSEFKEKKFSSGPYANTTKPSMRNMYMRTVTSAKCIFKKDKRGIYPSRCSKFGCGLIKKSHICLNVDGAEMDMHYKKAFHDISNGIIEDWIAQNPGKTPTFGECNDVLVRETQNTKHEVFGHKHMFRLHTWSI